MNRPIKNWFILEQIKHLMLWAVGKVQLMQCLRSSRCSLAREAPPLTMSFMRLRISNHKPVTHLIKARNPKLCRPILIPRIQAPIATPIIKIDLAKISNEIKLHCSKIKNQWRRCTLINSTWDTTKVTASRQVRIYTRRNITTKDHLQIKINSLQMRVYCLAKGLQTIHHMNQESKISNGSYNLVVKTKRTSEWTRKHLNLIAFHSTKSKSILHLTKKWN